MRAHAAARAFVLLLLIFILLLYVLLSSILFHFIYRHHHLNRNLQDLIAWQGLVQHIPGMKLSAKVFRTFNASQCLAEQLYATRSSCFPALLCRFGVLSFMRWVRRNTVVMQKQLEMKDNEKMLFFNDCNFQVAVLCNHCKTPAKNFGDKQEEKKKQLQEMEKADAALARQIVRAF